MNKNFYIIFLIILLFTSIVYAQDKIENFVTFDTITMSVSASSNIGIKTVGSDPELAEMRTSLTFVPFDTEQQDLININGVSNPSATIEEKEGEIIYNWNNPNEDKLTFGFNSEVKVNNIFPKIRSKIQYPILNLDEEYIKYVKPTEKIIITDEIARQAAEIIEGEDDLYKVVYKLADWTKTNINYDLNTLTAKAVQDAGWVLQNRQGVCDEMTTLFTSFLRSQGIPARFVSGMVYTNVYYDWGPHGWAEVYFPGIGWVPYDPTFGQYAFVDPSHVKMKDAFDSADPSINYNWRSRDIEIITEELDLEVDLISTGKSLSPLVTIDVDLLKNSVSFDSYVPLQVHVTNPKDYYVSIGMYVTKAPGLIGDNFKTIYLEPNSEKDLYWIIEVPNGDNKFVYTSEIEVKTQFGAIGLDTLEYSSKGEVYTLEAAENRINNLEAAEEIGESKFLSFVCNPDKKDYYEYDSAVFDCTLINKGDNRLDNLQICLQDDCRTINLNVNEQARLTYGLNTIYEDVYLIAKNNDIIKYSYPNYVFSKIPNLQITKVEYPKTLGYDQTGDFQFTLESDSEASNVQVIINKKSKLDLNKFSGERLFTVPISGHKFGSGNKKVEIDLVYFDGNNNKYEAHEEFDIHITNIAFFDKIKFWIGLLVRF